MERELTVAVIPARGNSKGVPRKNIKLLNGVPLLAYVLLAALSTPGIDLVVVSTEDQEIQDVATKYAELYKGKKDFAEFMILHRPHDLSLDWVQTDDVVLHALRNLSHGGMNIGTMLLLQPTNPFLDMDNIAGALKEYWDSEQATIISVQEIQWPPEGYLWTENWHGVANPRKLIEPYGHDPYKRRGRQWEKKPQYVENGAIYIFDAQRLKVERSYRMAPFVAYQISERAGLDINTWKDWREAEDVAKTYYTTIKS